MGGGETNCKRGFLASLSDGEGGASPKSCSSGTSHSDTQSRRTGSKTQDMTELINRRGWGGKEHNKGCTREESKGRRQPSTTWCCHKGHSHACQRCCAFAGLAWPVPTGP